MLVLSRKKSETLHIGDDVVVTIVNVQGNRVTLGIVAPREVNIARGELLELATKEAEEVAAPSGIGDFRPEKIGRGWKVRKENEEGR